MVYRFGILRRRSRGAPDTNPSARVARAAARAALALLLARAGDMSLARKLRAHLGRGDATLTSIAGCVLHPELRAALGDLCGQPRFVQTLPRRGFSFIAPVESIADGDAPAAAAAETADPPPRQGDRRRRMDRRRRHRGCRPDVGAAAREGGRDRASPRPIVAVAVFENETGDPSHDARCRRVDVIVERLTGSVPRASA